MATVSRAMAMATRYYTSMLLATLGHATIELRMLLDDLALRLQRLLDRLVRRLHLGRVPEATQRRVLIVQIDGLSRSVLEQALANRTAPFLARLLRQRGWRLTPMSVGLPTSTPAVQMSVMYGVRPDIPGFHYHDKRRRSDVYFPRGHDALRVEAAQAQGRRGILEAGSAYRCVFTGGPTSNLLTFAMIPRPRPPGPPLLGSPPRGPSWGPRK